MDVLDSLMHDDGAGLHTVTSDGCQGLVRELVGDWRRVDDHSACGGFPPAPEAIKPSPWFLRMPVLHGPPQCSSPRKLIQSELHKGG